VGLLLSFPILNADQACFRGFRRPSGTLLKDGKPNLADAGIGPISNAVKEGKLKSPVVCWPMARSHDQGASRTPQRSNGIMPKTLPNRFRAAAKPSTRIGSIGAASIYQKLVWLSWFDAADAAIKDAEATQTPEESLDSAFKEHQESLAGELLETVKQSTPESFELPVVKRTVWRDIGRKKASRLVRRLFHRTQRNTCSASRRTLYSSTEGALLS
jgi:hypothetical protein